MTPGETLQFIVEPVDTDGLALDTTLFVWKATLDSLGPNALPARYTLATSNRQNRGITVTLADALSAVIAGVSVYTISAKDSDGIVRAYAYGSIVLQGVAL